jgi:hypothetical protein
MKTYTTKLLLILILALDSNQTYAKDSYNNLIAPEGFHVELFASDILAPRQMAEGKDFIFVGGIKGQIFAVSKINPKQKILIASELNNSRGVALNNGDLYFAEVDKIWVIRDIEKLLDSDPDKTLNYELFNDDFLVTLGMAANGLNLVLTAISIRMLGLHVIFVMMDSQKTVDMHQLSNYKISHGKQWQEELEIALVSIGTLKQIIFILEIMEEIGSGMIHRHVN